MSDSNSKGELGVAKWEPAMSHKGEWPMNAPGTGRIEVSSKYRMRQKGQVTPGGIPDDDDVVAWLEPELRDEMIEPVDGVDESSGERVGNRKGGRRGDSIFGGEKAVYAFCIL
jgi:hypothetical protein